MFAQGLGGGQALLNLAQTHSFHLRVGGINMDKRSAPEIFSSARVIWKIKILACGPESMLK